jgi:hypothetical protein
MPLSFTGDQMETIAGVSMRATDHTGKRVVVRLNAPNWSDLLG